MPLPFRLRRRPAARFLGLALLALAGLASPLAARSVRAQGVGFAFLNIGAGARATAMGDAQTAVTGDPAALYWNPATLVALDRHEASLTHVEWFQNFRLESATLGGRLPFVHYGVMVTGLYAGQDALVRRDSTGADQGHFGYYDLAVAAGLARQIVPGLSAGLAGKLIVESIDDVRYGSVALDGGALWTTPIPGLTAGAAFSNLGPASSTTQQNIDLPLAARAGVAYVRDVPAIGGVVTLAADGEKRRGDGEHAHLGGEVLLRRVLALDAGWRSGNDSQSASLGGGVIAGHARVFYAYTPTSTGLGTTHRVTLRVAF